MGIKEIVDRILEEGERVSQEIIINAEEEKRRRLAELEREGERIFSELFSEGKEKVDFEIQQNIIAEKTKLRVKILEEKNKILSEIYEKFEAEICNLSEREYKELMKKLILKYCVGGEEIVIGGLDKDILNMGFIEEINKELRSKGKKEIAYNGVDVVEGMRGVVIREGCVEKNFLLPSVFRYIRETTIEEINKILFSELNDEIDKFFL